MKAGVAKYAYAAPFLAQRRFVHKLLLDYELGVRNGRSCYAYYAPGACDRWRGRGGRVLRQKLSENHHDGEGSVVGKKRVSRCCMSRQALIRGKIWVPTRADEDRVKAVLLKAILPRRG